MKRGIWLVLPALIALVVSSVLAGGAGGHDGNCTKCTKSVAECLTSMTNEIKARGFSGIESEKDETTGQIRITRLVPGTPAETAGLLVGDVLVALNGVKLADERNDADLVAVKKSMKVGSILTYTISRDGQERKVTLKTAPVPEEVLAQWVGHHMLEHVNTEVAKN
jgi:C-terminal processing protease CtpA/Prc